MLRTYYCKTTFILGGMQMKNNVNKKVGTSQIKHFIVLTAVLFAFWILLSGKMEAKYLVIGFLTSLISVWVTLPLLRLPSETNKGYYYPFDFPYFRYAFYWLWLLKEIIKANIDIAMVVLSPKLPINPQIVEFKRSMSNPIAHVTLANSITLTPGTITMDVADGVYTIHALTDGAGEALENGQGEMMVRISRIFGEKVEGEPAKQRRGEI